MAESNFDAWHFIHEAHAYRTYVCVCAAPAEVVYDNRKPTPYEINGCVVGYVVVIDHDGFVLAPVSDSFRTRVRWVRVREAWPRSMAPSPCPNCGAGLQVPERAAHG